MIKIVENGTRCNGCADCIHCGREYQKDYEVDLICDHCKDSVDDLYDDDCGGQFCLKCALLNFSHITWQMVNDDPDKYME